MTSASYPGNVHHPINTFSTKEVCLNSVNIAGNLVRDPELRYTPTGTAVCNMRIAVNVPGDEALFVDVVAWEKQAEACAEALRKGHKMAVSGSLRPESWTDSKTNEKRSKIVIRAVNVEFMTLRGVVADDGYPPLDTQGEAPRAPSATTEPSLPF